MASLQVGAFCYADAAAAAAAACNGLPLSVGAASGGLSSIECVGVAADGNLTMQSGFQSLPCVGTGCAWTYSQSEISPSYAPCWHGDVVSAGLLLFVAVLAAWAPCYGVWRVYKFINYSRADSTL